jgi:hypothetical protein
MFFMYPHFTDDSPSLYLLRSFGPGKCSIVLLILFSAAMCFFPFQGCFVGATSLVIQQQLSPHVLHTQPSSRTF